IKDASDNPPVIKTPEEPIFEIKDRMKIGRNESISKPFPRRVLLTGLSLLLSLVLVSVLYLIFKGPESSNVIQKAIACADPFEIWSTYEGKIRLRSIWADGEEFDELIEINNYNDSYRQSTVSGNQRLISGFENGKYYQEIRDNETNTLLRAFKEDSIDREGIDLWKQHHIALQFCGFLMELENSGLKMNKNAKRVRFQGNRCYSVEFKSDTVLRLNNYFHNTNWILFIDRKDYTHKGGRVENLKLLGHTYNITSIYSGKIIVNRLTLPMCKVNFLSHNNSLFDIEVITSPE
ncbi:MAG TPA: hypothetical protein VK861_06960, partial [Bacteroidales bacterium]|nr:hypothetical protein [Bacteroidales bacterium]